jgi:Spy/CpxP family protein refolding chaperone
MFGVKTSLTTAATAMLLAAFCNGIAIAQHHEHQAATKLGAATTPAGYAGQQTREIKALSAQEQQDWLDGKGMGLAKPAELNGYPGPMHTLEHGKALKLTDTQRSKTETLMQQHKSAVRELGKQLIAEERNLDAQFAQRKITVEQVNTITAKISALQGQIRAEHLRTHLAQTEILTPEQVASYNALRGYGGSDGNAHQHKSHAH